MVGASSDDALWWTWVCQLLRIVLRIEYVSVSVRADISIIGARAQAVLVLSVSSDRVRCAGRELLPRMELWAEMRQDVDGLQITYPLEMHPKTGNDQTVENSKPVHTKAKQEYNREGRVWWWRWLW